MVVATELTIDGRQQPLSQLKFSSMSLSSGKLGLSAHPFVIAVDKNWLIEHLSGPYQDWVHASKADDAVCGSPQDALAEAGYPLLVQVLECPSLRQLVIGSYLINDFMQELFPSLGKASRAYWFDTIESIHVTANTIAFRGVCFKTKDVL